MRKFSLSLLSIFVAALLIGGDSYNNSASAQLRSSAYIKSKTDRVKDADLAASIKKFTDAPSGKLREIPALGNSGMITDLGGAFQNVMLSRLDDGGEPVAACVTNLEEANAFFGRNLETGAQVPQTNLRHESLSTVAARHGMSEQEFLYYSKLAAEAVQQQVVMSPQSATITIVNGDGSGEGFNDTTAKAPEGGNAGTTLGAQRLNLFTNAAAIWGTVLDSSVPIKVNAQFNSIAGCTTSGGVLGSAGTNYTIHDFPGAPFANTDYHIALGNKYGGVDYTGGGNLIQATFNSDVDTGCLGAGTRFYYGLDNSTPANTVNLLVVLLHELGHGLGFSSFASNLSISAATNTSPIVVTTSTANGLANGDKVTILSATGNTAANGTWTISGVSGNTFQLTGSTGNGTYSGNGIIRGAYASGRPDAWSRLLYDRTTGKYWSAMTTAERSASMLNNSNLMWDGASVRIASSGETAGRDAATGRLQMYTPASFAQGSTLSHWDTTASPDLLMEPIINLGLPLSLDMTRQEMRDIGWYRDGNANNIADTISGVTPNGGVAIIGSATNITWTNGDSFSKNVTIELSTDGGVTYSTAIATDIANTGTYSWTVPNATTTTARVRVREAGYAVPIAASSGNFSISLSPSAAAVSVEGRVADADGHGIRNAVVTLTDGSGFTSAARTNAFGFYLIDGVPAGRGYTVGVQSKAYRFEPRFVAVDDAVAGFDFAPVN